MRKAIALSAAVLGMMGVSTVAANASTVGPMISEIPCYTGADYAQTERTSAYPDICFVGLGVEYPNLPGTYGLWSGGYSVQFEYTYNGRTQWTREFGPDQAIDPAGGAAVTVVGVDIIQQWIHVP